MGTGKIMILNLNFYFLTLYLENLLMNTSEYSFVFYSKVTDYLTFHVKFVGTEARESIMGSTPVMVGTFGISLIDCKCLSVYKC